MSKITRRLFGTDGVRGIANCYPMESAVAVKLGQAVARVFRNADGLNRIVVGKDTRLSGYVIESSLVAGICSMGMDAMLVGPLPTPGIAFIAHSMRARAGVMVSASHNPVEYNGIKFFDNKGFKLDDRVEAEMEEFVFSDKLDDMRSAPDEMGKAFRIDDASGRYLQYLKDTFPPGLSLEGVRIVLDCANGAGYKVAPALFGELGADVITTAIEPDGHNINLNCGALHPERMAKLVREHSADVGIALDGDADRLIMCDETGAIVDGDGVLAICALHLNAKGSLAKSTVVGTKMSNMGLEVALADHGIKLVRADVGDRYVMDVMRREGYNLGGETSGHIIFLHHTTSGDGALAALRVLSVMCQQGRPLSEVRKVFTPFPQINESIHVIEKKPFEELPVVQSAINVAQDALKGCGRVLVRYSGTEAIARVMVEGPRDELIRPLALKIAQAIRDEQGDA